MRLASPRLARLPPAAPAHFRCFVHRLDAFFFPCTTRTDDKTNTYPGRSSTMDSTNFQPSFAVPPILLRHQRSYARQCTASSSSSNSSGSSRRNTRTPKAFSWFEGSTQGIFRTKKSQPEENTVTSGTVEAAQPPPPAPVEEEYVETDQERRDRERVEYMAAKLFQNSPMIRFMTRQLKLVGCDPYHQVDPSDRTAIPRLAIQSCPDENTAGGFTPSQEKGQHYSNAGIVICADRILNKQHLEDTLAHEMIHWWDHCRFRVDWKDLRQIACSEVSAGS